MKFELQLDHQDFTMNTDTLSPTMPIQAAGNGTGHDHNPTAPPSVGTGAARDGGDMLSRVVQGAHQTIDRLADTAAPHVHKLQEGMSVAGDAVSERAVLARDVSEEWAESLRATVREHPLAAVFAALAVGMVVARVTR